MPGENSSEAIVNEIAKSLAPEMYKDTVQPPAREAGKALEDIVKTFRLALFPFQFCAAWQDRLESFIDNSVRKVPSDRRQLPPVQIVGPVLEGLRYEPADTPIDRLFSDLLSSSMDRDNINKAHPSYPLIIRQLSSDEAVILRRLYTDGPVYKLVKIWKFQNGRFSNNKTEIEKDEYPKEELTFPQNLDFYMQHLTSMDLAGIYEYKEHELISDCTQDLQLWSRAFYKYQLTGLGQRFMDACVYSAET